MRNTTRQASLETRLEVLSNFVVKLRGSGYATSTVDTILTSGLTFYYQKVRTWLEGGPPLNSRGMQDPVASKRKKLGAAERWFKRRRGGQAEKDKKTDGWRDQKSGHKGKVNLGKDTRARGRAEEMNGTGALGVRNLAAPLAASRGETSSSSQGLAAGSLHPMIEATLSVPYTPGSELQKSMQRAEDDFSKLICTRRVRVVESGGNQLIHMLGRNDPWGHMRQCDDDKCNICLSRQWIQDQSRIATEEKEKLPPQLVTKTSGQCRREGVIYVAQCLLCIPEGLKTLYWGESNRSARQRTKEHATAVEAGMAESPMVEHVIRHHGGKKPQVCYTIDKVEPKALQRAVRESVRIANMGDGITSMNRCSEWGAPRVPVITATGGDGDESGPRRTEPLSREREDWTRDMVEKLNAGSLKRVVYWDRGGDEVQPGRVEYTGVEEGPDARERKRARRSDPEPETEWEDTGQGQGSQPASDTVEVEGGEGEPGGGEGVLDVRSLAAPLAAYRGDYSSSQGLAARPPHPKSNETLEKVGAEVSSEEVPGDTGGQDGDKDRCQPKVQGPRAASGPVSKKPREQEHKEAKAKGVRGPKAQAWADATSGQRKDIGPRPRAQSVSLTAGDLKQPSLGPNGRKPGTRRLSESTLTAQRSFMKSWVKGKVVQGGGDDEAGRTCELLRSDHGQDPRESGVVSDSESKVGRTALGHMTHPSLGTSSPRSSL